MPELVWVVVGVGVKRYVGVGADAFREKGMGVSEGGAVDVGKDDKFEMFSEDAKGGMCIWEHPPILDRIAELFVWVIICFCWDK